MYKFFILIFLMFALKANGQTASAVRILNSNGKALSWEANSSPKLDSLWVKTQPVSVVLSGTTKVSGFSKEAVQGQRSTMVFWVYNPEPQPSTMIVKTVQDNENYYTFPFRLNFKGWRTAWVMFHRDMQKYGNPTQINYVEIQLPEGVKGLIINDLRIMPEVNPRSPMQDAQLPFVNEGVEKTANAHWSALYHFWKYMPDNKPVKISSQEKTDFDTIANRQKKIIFVETKLPQNFSVSNLQKQFEDWQVKPYKSGFLGVPVLSVNDKEILKKEQIPSKNIKDFTTLMLHIAIKYQQITTKKQRKKLKNMYLTMLKYMHNQGWTAGSGMGSLHHLGYNFKGYYASCLLMKSEIKKAGLLAQTQQDMAWFSGLYRIYEPQELLPHSNIDVFNTLLEGMLCSVLVSENPAQMKQFSKWLSFNMLPNFSIKGTFKPDGAVVHHATLYPAYGVGGFEGLSALVYALHNTAYAISNQAFESFKKVMLTMHRYANPRRWAVSLSGRHPTGNFKVPARPYYLMAISAPQLDKELASAYMLIKNNPKDKITQKFSEQGVSPTLPQGHWSVNYGLLGLHRRADWLLSVRGHNRYFVTHESYPNQNVFGRFLTYGQAEVLFNENDQNAPPSHFSDQGWDWSLIPGATTLALPTELMRAQIINPDKYSGVEEMLISDALFAGGLTIGDDGIFAMQLHGHDKYDMGSFRANKSWFMFDDWVFCLGSDINNSRADFDTRTTVFQNFLGEKPQRKSGVWLEGNAKSAAQKVYLDSRGIGYIFPENQPNMVFSVGEQFSRDQKDQNNTHGFFETLTFQHGKAPQNEKYAYAMLIKTQKDDLLQVAKSVEKGAIFQIKQQDCVAHILHYLPKKITSFAIFEKDNLLNDRLINSVDTPCLIAYKENDNQREIVVVNPDLAFYQGEDDSPVVAGKRQEVSIYSRKWYTQPPKPTQVSITLNGIWQVTRDAENKVKSISHHDRKTTLTVQCAYGLASEIFVEPIYM